MASPTTRYWAGAGPKRINCTKPGCECSIPTGALVHKKLTLGENPKCRSCGKSYTIPPGAEKPYLKGQAGKGNAATSGGKATKLLERKDQEIANLKAKLKEAKVELPSEETNDKQDLEGLKSARELLQKRGLPIGDVETQIQELEAKTKQGTMALPTIEARLTAAQAKVTKCATKYNNLLAQLKKAKDEGIKAASLVEQLEQQKVEALAGQGFAHVGIQPIHKPPEDLEEEQKAEWQKALEAAEATQKEIMRQALDGLSQQLQQMYENYKAANAQKAKEAAVAAEPATATASDEPDLLGMEQSGDEEEQQEDAKQEGSEDSEDEYPWDPKEAFRAKQMQDEGGAVKRLAAENGDQAHPEAKPSKKAIRTFKQQVSATAKA